MKLKLPLLLIFCFLHCSLLLKGQSLSISAGPFFTKSKAISPIVNAKEDLSNSSFPIIITYEHFLPKTKMSILGSYSKFDGFTYIKYQKGGVRDPFGNPVLSDGYNGVDVYRFDIEFAYRLTNKKRYFFKPFGGLGIQSSKWNGFDLLYVPVNGPDYIETEPTIAKTYGRTQIVPTLGMKTGWVFWKRLELNFTVKGVYGFIPYQRLTLKYQYKGEVQPDAVYVSDGTGWFFNVGIGYRFAKLIK